MMKKHKDKTIIIIIMRNDEEIKQSYKKTII